MWLGGDLFHWFDWVVVAATLGASLAIGIYYALKGNKSNEDLLVGGRNMAVLPVAASVMATYISAITVLGYPAEVYSFGGQIIIHNIVSAIGVACSAFIFVPYFYKMKLTSINEYLEHRFDSTLVRKLASFTFILQQITLSSVILYAPSLALEAFLSFPVWLSILSVGLCSTIYTSVGGLKAVVFTDLFQSVMMVVGMVAIVIKGFSSVGGVGEAFRRANNGGRLNFIDTTFDPFMRHNIWNFLLGSTFYAVLQPAVQQLQVQRYCSMPTLAKAKSVILCSVPFKLLTIGLCLLSGISIFAMYDGCDPFKLNKIKKVDQIVPYFVVEEMASIPGMLGLFTACILSAVLSSVSSALNSLAAVTWEDFLKGRKLFAEMTPTSQANTTRVIGFLYGVLIIMLAFLAQNLGALYSATYAAFGATAGAIYGVFIVGMVFPKANAKGATIGLVIGLGSMMLLSLTAFAKKKTLPHLPTSIDQCPQGNITMIKSRTEPIEEMDSWAEKIFQLSYLLYSLVAAIITVTMGLLFSVGSSSKGVCTDVKYLHPAVRKFVRINNPRNNSSGDKI
ncbi:sodium-coupled monocarboxylate transporter 1 isoform X1 [Folsomia candida]|uniref:sodium-coupled monocarboxylate transporter 1 isoform X1 n=1 Tax=Folsomia candida TaxID=158441 RepID=UPI00160550DF|nr:sodium-coupled monocarboxylate transporter 1 isoform X1 [Folsomia candida]